jgi:hypothetical protein
MTRGRIILACIISAISLSTCKPDPVFPVEPILTFKEFIQPEGTDSLQVVFSFTDGDGDIGVAVNSDDSNMVLTPYVRDPATGQFVVMLNTSTSDPNDSIMYTYRIPHLSTSESGLEGDIYVTIDKSVLILFEDTLQFNAFLLDQSDHKSVVVRTPEVVLVP